jgi:hypothetical protein
MPRVDAHEGRVHDHAAAAGCWLSTAAIFRQPTILRNLICRSPRA